MTSSIVTRVAALPPTGVTLPGSTPGCAPNYIDTCKVGLGNTGIINVSCAVGFKAVVSISSSDRSKGVTRASTVCLPTVSAGHGPFASTTVLGVVGDRTSGATRSVVARGYTPLFHSNPYGGKGTVAGSGATSVRHRFTGSLSSGTPTAVAVTIKPALAGLSVVVTGSFTVVRVAPLHSSSGSKPRTVTTGTIAARVYCLNA